MSTVVRRALYGKLAGDTTLNNLLAAPPPGYSKNIFHNLAPGEVEYPLVLLNKQSGVPTETMGVPSAFETDFWLIKAVDRNSTADPAEAAHERIKALLNDASLTISGRTLMYVRRSSDVEYEEVTNGVRYQHVGALYRLVHEV